MTFFWAENVARGKMCNMSSLWVTSRHANAAVNGNTGGSWGSNNCIHSGDNDQSPWWEVNLGRPYPVYRIIVFARTGCEFKYALNVYLFDVFIVTMTRDLFI